MPRPCKCRFICATPDVAVFKPQGVPTRALECVQLGLDELEAVRLADLEGLYQDAGAERMGISRATFGRLVAEARRKISDALLNGKMLVFRGGPVVMNNMRTFECAACGARFEAGRGTGRPPECPSCHARTFHRAAEERGAGGGRYRRGRCGGGRDSQTRGRNRMRGGVGPARTRSESNQPPQEAGQ